LLLSEWYRSELKDILPRLIERWCNRIGTEIPTFDILSMPQRWGSCNKAKKHIVFNLELAKKPIECIEYIVAHEVIHLVERTHTGRFFRLLDTYFPNWKMLRDQLNEYPVNVS
jgi:predicted metal-dependent hydrolase